MTEHKGFTLWFTGLPGSGEITLAHEVGNALLERGCRAEVLGGEALRERLFCDLGDSRDDREALVRRIGFLAGLLARNGVAAVVAAFAPSPGVLGEVRQASAEPFLLIHLVGTPSAAIPDAYEPPTNAELVIDTSRVPVPVARNQIILLLEQMNLIPRDEGAHYSEEEEQAVMQRLKDLGYV